MAKALLTSKCLADAVTMESKMCILDTSWHLPKLRCNGKSEFKKKHIPGEAFFVVVVENNPEKVLADYVANLGIEKDTHVVLYNANQLGVFSVEDVPCVWTQRGLGAQWKAQALGAGRQTRLL